MASKTNVITAPRVLLSGHVEDVAGDTWDPPSCWSGLKITNRDRAVDFVQHFPVWRYPPGLDDKLCVMYSVGGYLSGGVNLPVQAVTTFEWKSQ
eukprot:IDg21684t1